MKPHPSQSKSSASRNEALRAALKFLSYRARSEAEVKNRLLLRGYTTAVIEIVVHQLRAQRLLDDARLALNWALHKAERGYGRKRIERELAIKGVPRAVIREALRQSFNEGDEEDKAKSLLEKRFRETDLGDPRMVRRAAAFLQRRGFDLQLVNRLLRIGVQED